MNGITNNSVLNLHLWVTLGSSLFLHTTQPVHLGICHVISHPGLRRLTLYALPSSTPFPYTLSSRPQHTWISTDINQVLSLTCSCLSMDLYCTDKIPNTYLRICKDVLNRTQKPLVIKSLPANAGDLRDMSSIPGLGRGPWRRAQQPSPVFLPGESHGQRRLVGCSPWGCKDSYMTEVTARTTKGNKINWIMLKSTTFNPQRELTEKATHWATHGIYKTYTWQRTHI